MTSIDTQLAHLSPYRCGMAEILHGDRIGRTGSLKVGCAAVVVRDGDVLLTRRTDNGLWCLPGGAMDPGESAAEAMIREVREETGLEVEAARLVGVYSSPDRVTRYRDGNTHQFVALCFAATIVGGELGLSDETTATAWVRPDELDGYDIMENHRERIDDCLAGRVAVMK